MPAVPRDQARLVAYGAAAVRIGIGVTGLVVPGPLGRVWVGPDGDRAESRMFARIVSGREIALGLGTLLALRQGSRAGGWLRACALADGVDFAVTASRFRSLPRLGRWLFLLGAAGASSTEAFIAPSVDG